VAGYAFAFGGSSNAILGTRFWASERFGANDYHPNVENYTNSNNVYKLNTQDPYIHFFYNYMLAFLVTNIAASAFAERCQVIVYVLFSIIMSGKFINTRHEWVLVLFRKNFGPGPGPLCPSLICICIFSKGFVYPFLAHWMWGANGWLGAIVGARVC